MSKVECITGVVAKPNLGIVKECYDRLIRSVDAVIHCTGNNNYNEQYRNYENRKMTDIRSVNVNGTINMLKVAN